jgi:3-oxoacyl-[acyl-carrier-protein] synthase-3
MTKDVYITQTASFMPNAPVGNDDMERILGQAGHRPSRARRTVLRSNGIKTRHYAIDPVTLEPTHSNAQLAAEAVKRLGQNYELAKVGVLACGTSIPDQIVPGHGVMVHGELELPETEVVSTSGVCISGAAALKYAYFAVASGQTESAISTGSELASAVFGAKNYTAEVEHKVDALEDNAELAFEKDFLRWMLSDGAGAVLLESTPRPGVLNLRIDWIEIQSYAGEMETCMYAGAVKNEDGSLKGWARFDGDQRAYESVMAVKQDVRLLNENIMHYAAEKPLAYAAKKHKLKPEDVDHFLPHYSSEFFRPRLFEAMAKIGFNVPYERWFTNLTTRGNTGAASIYIMLDELLKSGRVTPGQRILCWVPESGRFSGCFFLVTAVQG